MKHHSSSRERGQATHTNVHDAPGHKKSELKNNMHKASFSRGKANHKTLLGLMGALPMQKATVFWRGRGIPAHFQG